METKMCPKCKIEKPVSEFHKNRCCKDGLCQQCKECVKKYLQTDKAKARTRKHEQSEKCKAMRKKYHQSKIGKENARKNARKYYWLHKKSCNERSNQYIKTKNGKIARKKGDKIRWRKSPMKSNAKVAVYNAVHSGKLPYPNTLKCVKCGKQAQQYHHYKGYAKEHWLDVQPVCKICHSAIHLKYPHS